MLTDDDLTRELGAAFRAETQDLNYHGRRRPQRNAVVALPVAAVAIAIAAVGIDVATHHDPAPAPSVLRPAAPSAVTPSKATVNATIHLAGYTFHYVRTQGETAPVYATMETTLPPGLTPVPMPGTDAKAWVGKDPKTGDNAIYVQISDRNGGNLFALHSPVWTQDQLVDMLHNGTPATVPLVKE